MNENDDSQANKHHDENDGSVLEENIINIIV